MNKPQIFLISLFLNLVLVSNGQFLWDSIPVPDSIMIHCVAANIQNDIFLGTGGNSIDGGVYRSIDNLLSWDYILGNQHSNFEIHLNEISQIFIDWNRKLYKSTDNGNSWSMKFEGLSNIIIINSFPGGLMFANSGTGSYNSLIRSLDYGENWEEVLIFEDNVESVYDIAILNEDTIYIGTTQWFEGGGVYRSVDGGDTWDHIGMNNFHVLALELNSDGTLFAGTWGHNLNQFLSGLYIYNEELQLWEKLVGALVTDIVINTEDDIYIATADGVIESTNNGLDFEYINDGLFLDEVEGLALDSAGFLYAIAYNPPRLCRSFNPTTSVISQEAESELNVECFPNPFTDNFSLKIQGIDGLCLVRISFYNQIGQKVKEFQKITDEQGQLMIEDITIGVLSGIYFYSIQWKGVVYSDLIIKQ